MWEVRGWKPEAIETVWNWSLRQNSGIVGTFKGKRRSTISTAINSYSFITQLSVNVSASLTENMLASLRMALENLGRSIPGAK